MADSLCALLVVVCVALRSEAQGLAHLQPTGQGMSGIHRICDDCSDSIQLNISFPFGEYCHNECHVRICTLAFLLAMHVRFSYVTDESCMG